MSEEILVRCEACECAFSPEMQTERDGEIERVFFRCPYCGKRYLAAVTDAELRKNVHRYSQLANMNKVKHLSERMQRRLQKLKEKNVARSLELRAQYPLKEDTDAGE